MKNMRKTEQEITALVIVIVILAVGILGGLGYVLWNNFMNKPANDPQPTTSTHNNDPSIPTKKDPYDGWKTYKSTRDGYKLRYPSNWIAIKETSTDGPYIRNMEYASRAQGGYPEGYINLRVLRDEEVVSGSTLTPKEWYAKLGVSTVKKGPVTFTADTVDDYTLNDLDAKKAKSVFTETDEDIFLLHDGMLYEINMYPYGATKNATVKKILASFEFI